MKSLGLNRVQCHLDLVVRARSEAQLLNPTCETAILVQSDSSIDLIGQELIKHFQ